MLKEFAARYHTNCTNEGCDNLIPLGSPIFADNYDAARNGGGFCPDCASKLNGTAETGKKTASEADKAEKPAETGKKTSGKKDS